MEQLKADVEQLQQQKAFYEQQVQEEEGSSDVDANRLQILKNNLESVQRQLDQKAKELGDAEAIVQQRQAVIEEKVHADGVPFAVDGVDFTDLPPQVITLVEKIVKADRRRIYADHAAELDQLGNTHQSTQSAALAQIDELTKENASLKDDYNRCATENSQYVAEIAQLTRERDEARQNRDNAAAQLEEANKQIAQLKSQVDDYQKAKVFGEREAQNVTDITPVEQDDIQAAKEAVKKLYTSFENWGAINKVYKPDGTWTTATTEELQNNWVPEAEVSGQNSFRNEDTAAVAQSGGVPVTEIAITPPPVPSFQLNQTEVPDGIATGGGDATVPAMVAEQAVSRAEFEELAQRVAALENGKVTGNAA